MAPTASRPLATLVSRLPALSAEQGRMARLACDRRFVRWIDSVLGTAGARVVHAGKRAGIAVTLACRHGRLQLSGDASTLPGLEMVSRLPDKSLSRDVAEAMLSTPLSLLQPSLPGLAVHDLELRPAGGTHFELRCGALRVGLSSLDDDVARCLAGTLRDSVKASAAHLRRLRVPARLGLFMRELSLADLYSLAPGDIVVAGASHAGESSLRSCFSFGLGTIMQATTDVDIDSSTATLTEAPRMTGGNTEAAGPDLTVIGELGVPVAFEIDSARVSLDELAAFGEGSVIELDTPVQDASVRLVCFGQVVGTGRLVVVGDCLGVRIERMGMRPVDGQDA